MAKVSAGSSGEVTSAPSRLSGAKPAPAITIVLPALSPVVAVMNGPPVTKMLLNGTPSSPEKSARYSPASGPRAYPNVTFPLRSVPTMVLETAPFGSVRSTRIAHDGAKPLPASVTAWPTWRCGVSGATTSFPVAGQVPPATACACAIAAWPSSRNAATLKNERKDSFLTMFTRSSFRNWTARHLPEARIMLDDQSPELHRVDLGHDLL